MNEYFSRLTKDNLKKSISIYLYKVKSRAVYVALLAFLNQNLCFLHCSLFLLYSGLIHDPLAEQFCSVWDLDRHFSYPVRN